MKKEVRILEIKESVFADNDRQADMLRQELKEKGVFLMNLMSSPGAGKTTTLVKTIAALRDSLRIGVMEADIDSDVDARTIAETGVKSIQLHTGGMCHLDAAMTRQGIEGLDIEDVDFKNNGIKVTRKGGNEMVVYFGPEVEKALRNYLEVRKNIVPVEGHEHALFYSTQRKRIGVQAVGDGYDKK